MTVFILTRTAGRPTMFARLRESILNQQFEGEVTHVVHAEEGHADYAEADVVIRGPHLPKILNMTAPWELYNRRLLEAIAHFSGWVMFLDDDDMFTNETALARAYAQATSPDQLLIWKVERENGRISPAKWRGGLSTPEGRICWEGGSHHTKYLSYAKIDGDDGSDGRYWNQLSKCLPITWVDEVITKPQLEGRAGKGHGRRRDR